MWIELPFHDELCDGMKSDEPDEVICFVREFCTFLFTISCGWKRRKMLAKDTKGREEGVGAYLLMNSKERVNGWMVNIRQICAWIVREKTFPSNNAMIAHHHAWVSAHNSAMIELNHKELLFVKPIDLGRIFYALVSVQPPGLKFLENDSENRGIKELLLVYFQVGRAFSDRKNLWIHSAN